jgi:tetratricopeptide (TPR) repeat protein
MIRKSIILLFYTMISAGTVVGQQSIQHLEPQVLFANANYLMEAKNYGGARAYFEQYLETNDTLYQQEARYYTAICGLKLYHLDGEKKIQEFINEYPASPLSSKAYMEMGVYFFQDRNYKQAIVYLAKVEQKSVSKEKRALVQYDLGYSYFATKKFNKALIEFNKVKKGSSQFKAPAKYYAGFIEYDQQDYEAALNDYTAIQHNQAFATSVPYMITSIHYKSGNYQQLIDYTRPVIDNQQKVQQKGQMAILLAESYYELGNYQDSYYYFGLAEKSVKFTAQSVYHYGITAAKSGNKAKSIKLLSSVAGQNNRVGVLASFTLGKLYLEEGNQEFAFTAFKSVVDNKHGKGLKEDASFAAGKLAYDLGRFSECISILTSHRNKYPESKYNSNIDDLLAQAFLNTRNYKPALDYIEGLANKSTIVWQAYQQATFYYGVDFYNDRKFSEAIIYFNKSLEHPLIDEYTLKANLWVAEAYSIGRRYKSAIPNYNAAIKIGKVAAVEDYWRAVYGRGYAYYNTGSYDKALTDFKHYIDNVSEDNSTYGDALVRLADCYYVSKDYRTAIQHFTRAIRGLVNEKDYAYYQAGVIYGILEDFAKAENYLDRVINVYNSSAFYDDALFEKGLLQLKQEKFKQAITTFNKLLEEKPRSPYVSFALERSAVANFNLGNYSKTVNLYQQFIDNYPNNPGISDALIGLQESMRLAGREDEFDNILKSFKQKNPDISGLEKVEFESLKGLYNNQQYAKAARGFSGYLSAYPNDINAIEVKYLLAESLYRLDKVDSALNLYYQLYKSGGEIRLYSIAERIADIEYARQNISSANKYYSELVKVAISNNQKLRAWLGLMNGHYQLGAYDSTLAYVDLLLKNGGNRNDFIVAATLKKGLSLLNMGQFDNALLMFEQTTNLAKDKNGAEAQYYIGVILNQQEDYTNSNEALYVIPEQYGMYTEWLDKAFLLVAENFIAMKEYFQAKATLQSIIDNSADTNTVKKATERYEWVSNEEAKEVNLIPDSLNTVEIDTSSNQHD